MFLQTAKHDGFNGIGAAALRELLFVYKFFKKKPIWLISDRATVAGDNGEALFAYLVQNQKQIDARFVIDAESPDFERLSKIGPVLKRDSFEHKMLSVLCEYIVSSHAENQIYNPLRSRVEPFKSFWHKTKFVFLQHGITKNDVSNWLGKPNKNFFGIVTTAKPEYEFFLKKELFGNIDKLHIVTPSNWLNGVVNESFLKKFPVTTIYNGIDLSVFHPVKSDFKIKNNLSGKKIVLGVANVWEKRKGLDDFIKLSKLLPKDYKIVLAGLSEKQIAALPSNILGISRTENIAQLVELYSSADVYVNTSVEETMGLTTVEALATGTPAVVYNATAVPEVVNEKCGKVVNAGDINGLIDAITTIDLSAEDCINRAAEFEKNKQYEMYLELYKKILGSEK